MAETEFRGVGAADPTEWLGRIVTETGPDTVELSDDPTSEIPFGVVHRVDPTLTGVEVCIGGRTRLRVGAAGLSAEDVFVAAANDAGDATMDGKGVLATAGDYYAGRALARVDTVEDDLIPFYVSIGQLNPGE